MISEDTLQKTIKYSSLVVLVLQSTCATITVFYGETIKFVASIIMCCVFHKSLAKGLSDIYTECVHYRKELVKVLIPAAIYTIQNILVYVALDNLPSATFMVTYQFKIFTTALFAVIVLKRRLSLIQWIALFVLFCGIAIVQVDGKLSEARKKADNSSLNSTEINKTEEGNSIVGFVSVLIACVLSGFAGIYFEKILKKSTVSLWVRNVQMAGPSIVFSLLCAFGKDYSEIFKDGYNPVSVSSNMMKGFDWKVWVMVVINAFGGIVVAIVIKFADNILKAFATSFSIIINCVIAYFWFGFDPSYLFLLGGILVIAAVFGYSLFPNKTAKKSVDTEEGNTTEETFPVFRRENECLRGCCFWFCAFRYNLFLWILKMNYYLEKFIVNIPANCSFSIDHSYPYLYAVHYTKRKNDPLSRIIAHTRIDQPTASEYPSDLESKLKELRENRIKQKKEELAKFCSMNVDYLACDITLQTRELAKKFLIDLLLANELPVHSYHIGRIKNHLELMHPEIFTDILSEEHTTLEYLDSPNWSSIVGSVSREPEGIEKLREIVGISPFFGATFYQGFAKLFEDDFIKNERAKRGRI
ncbi:hypothetical protein PRIPAC_96511 [Pristionchus pacificus]|uniref:Nstp-5 n=1 Tax=Pristionchus pacificus TaxID=54126 RepID=A0A2A6BXM3_PRIPA|nr:hypothetical protein PRIPAC_96511 [Pristionchus pacificus]|eukprot:PDM70674.1 nstp-5 [Pristionchus pacificus]